MANLSFSLSFRLPLSIKTTHVQPHGLVFFPDFFLSYWICSSVTSYHSWHALSSFSATFLPCPAPQPWACSLPPTELIHSSLYPRRTHWLRIRMSSPQLSWEEKGWQQNKVKPNLWQELGNYIHPWEPWNGSLLWQQVPQLRFQKGWMTQWVGSSSHFEYLTFLNWENQGIKN